MQSLHTTTQQIVDIRADEEVQDSTPLYERVSISKPYKDTLEHTVKDILNRPYLLASYSWAGAIPNGEALSYWPIRQKMLEQENVRSKLEGFKYMRHGYKIRVMCNFTPVQTGKLLVAAIPVPPTQSASYIDGDLYSLYQLSTCRHVEIDAGSQEEVELDLPYFQDKSAYAASYGVNDYEQTDWQLVIKVLNQLGGASNSEVVDVNIYGSFTDIDLAMPTGQSATEGEKKVEKGIISSTLDTVSAVAGSLSTIPILSDIAGPVSWAAGAASGVASFFGFSKPFNEGITQRVAVQPGTSLANVDGIDTSIKLSAMTNNGVEQLDGQDEMGISQLAKRQGLIGQGEWAFADARFAPLYSCKVTPIQQKSFVAEKIDPESPVTKQEILAQPPVSYLASMFTLWRGDMSYRFSFAKNEFYTGKVIVSFRPTRSAPFAGQTTTDMKGFTVESDEHDNNVYRRIMSIKNSNDFVVTIPYVYDKYWANVNEGIGFLEVAVFNRLQASSIVPQKIQFNVWAFSNNISFAYPAAKLLPSFFGIDSGDKVIETPSSVLVSQRAKMRPMAIGQSIQSDNVNDIAQSDYLFQIEGTESPEKYTTGEMITNLRPLTRRFNLYDDAPSIRVSSASLNKQWYLKLEDYQSNPRVSETLIEHVAGMFTFKRGGLRFKGYNGKDFGLGFAQQSDNDTLDATSTVPERFLRSGANALTLNTVNGVLEVEVPFYCDRERWFTEYSYDVVNMPSFTLGFLDIDNTPDTDGKIWFVAGADDFTLSFYRGIPGVVVGPYTSP